MVNAIAHDIHVYMCVVEGTCTMHRLGREVCANFSVFQFGEISPSKHP